MSEMLQFDVLTGPKQKPDSLENAMKKLAIVLAIAALACCGSAIGQDKAPAKTISEMFDRHTTNLEGEFVPAAEAMPDDKYDFAPPTSLGEFKGVRTFAQQVKHVAAVNYMLAAAILGEKPPVDLGKGENGPDNLKTKAEIVKFLKDSFEYSHKALKSINDQNAMGLVQSPFGTNQTSRANLAVFIIAHPFDHYGQMVEYLRMNGVVPPASRG
jgi:uncharacterized damage-inducible protein DinB